MRSSLVLLALCLCLLFGSCFVAAGDLRERLQHISPRPIPSSPASSSVHKELLGSAATTCSVNGLSGTCISVSSCQSSADHTSVPGHCPGGDDIQCCVSQPEPAAGCGTAALKRAETWVNVNLQYCQSANGQRDYDSACTPICSRASNRGWDAYRSDCSGFVSYAYGLGAPGRVTGEFAPYETDISYKLASATDLQPGDAINSTPDEHIMLFREWLNAEKTQASFFEEPGCSPAIHWARRTDSAVTIHSDGTISVAENGMNFYPIRFYSNKNVC
jgi:hypothetical protein